jgi:hypothetical protein
MEVHPRVSSRLSRNTDSREKCHPPPARGRASIELRFVHRRNERKSLALPCSAAGRVDLHALDERKRNEYLFARALMGRDYAFPVMGKVTAALGTGT